MTSERRDSISEDWEEIDDVGSVRSFDGLSRPTSPAPPGGQTPAAVSPTVQGSSNTHTQLALRLKDDNAVDSRPSSTTTVPVLNEEKSTGPSEPHSFQSPRNDDISAASYNHFTKMREPGDLPLYWNGKERKWDDKDLDMEMCDDQHQINKSIDFDDSPRVYHEACNDVITTLTDVANFSHEIGSHRISTTSMIRQTCERLLAQTKELEKMLEVYRQHWRAQAPVVQIPLSPDVLDLLTKLYGELCITATLLKTVKPQEGILLQVEDIPIDKNCKLSYCGEGLGQISNSFADFLPIMRADFDTFMTKSMLFQPATTGSVQRPRRRIPPNPTVSRVRKELYALKDCLASMSCFLKEVNTDPCIDWAIDSVVTDSADLVVEVITKTLTNNPSEWIDSHVATQGGLTYQKFVELDSEILHDIYMHLKSHKDELDMVPDEDGALFSWKKVRDYQCDQLARGGTLEAIYSLIQFVKELLLITE